MKTKKDPRLRRSSQEYKDVTTLMDFARMPTYDEWYFDMRTLWESEYSEAEKRGTGPGSPGPIDFEQYMKESIQTLHWRKDDEVPMRLKTGIITKEDAVANIEFIEKLIEFAKRALEDAAKDTTSSNIAKETTSNVIKPYNADGTLNLNG